MLSKLLIFLWCASFAMPLQAESLRLVTQQYAPYIVQDGEQVKGLVVEIVEEAFHRAGLEISIEAYPWSRALYMLEKDQADGLFTIKKTVEREETMRFPQESLLSQDYVFFARKDSSFQFDGDFASVVGARIGVVQNTSYGARFDAAVKAGTVFKLDAAHNYELTFRKLLGGRVDAVICSHLVGLDMLKQLGGLDRVEVRGPVVETAVSYLVFSRGRDLAQESARFDRALAAMKKDGTIRKINARYRERLSR